MKPRIKKIAGLWMCHYPKTLLGLGYTPVQAYEDWLNMVVMG